MINVKELRFGNKVQPDKEHAAQFNNIRVWSVTQIYEGGFTVDYHWPGKWFEGIPLSPEISEACGFVKETGDYSRDSVVYSNGIRLYQHEENEYSLYGYNEQRVYVSYLHELQNLFSIFTGTELTINLEKVKV